MNPLTQVGRIVLKCGPKNSGPFIQNSGPLLFEGGSSEPPWVRACTIYQSITQTNYSLLTFQLLKLR